MAKKTNKPMNPILVAALGGAAGFGGARVAKLGGNFAARKVEALANLPVNIGSATALVLGVVMTVYGRRPFIQGAGVGMALTGGLDIITGFGGNDQDDNDNDDDDNDDENAPSTRRGDLADDSTVLTNPMDTTGENFNFRKVLELSEAYNN